MGQCDFLVPDSGVRVVLALVCALDVLDCRVPVSGYVHCDDSASIMYCSLYLSFRRVQPGTASYVSDGPYLWYSAHVSHRRPHTTESCRKDFLMTDEVVKQRK